MLRHTFRRRTRNAVNRHLAAQLRVFLEDVAARRITRGALAGWLAVEALPFLDGGLPVLRAAVAELDFAHWDVIEGDPRRT